ncbi:MAG: hypothetical protein HYV63_31210, partial [Candidatus Schekmanbacteria bacterium]|nr:hypothetical protein [Candidatus Schekmanbacteria bacterium]
MTDRITGQQPGQHAAYRQIADEQPAEAQRRVAQPAPAPTTVHPDGYEAVGDVRAPHQTRLEGGVAMTDPGDAAGISLAEARKGLGLAKNRFGAAKYDAAVAKERAAAAATSRKRAEGNVRQAEENLRKAQEQLAKHPESETWQRRVAGRQEKLEEERRYLAKVEAKVETREQEATALANAVPRAAEAVRWAEQLVEFALEAIAATSDQPGHGPAQENQHAAPPKVSGQPAAVGPEEGQPATPAPGEVFPKPSTAEARAIAEIEALSPGPRNAELTVGVMNALQALSANGHDAAQLTEAAHRLAVEQVRDEYPDIPVTERMDTAMAVATYALNGPGVIGWLEQTDNGSTKVLEKMREIQQTGMVSWQAGVNADLDTTKGGGTFHRGYADGTPNQAFHTNFFMAAGYVAGGDPARLLLAQAGNYYHELDPVERTFGGSSYADFS